MTVFELIALLLALTGLFGWINQRFVRLPPSIGLLLIGLLASLLLLALELCFSRITLYQELTKVVRQLDFQQTVLQGILGFLLFAGALQVDLARLRTRASSVAVMATVGVLISTVVVGFGAWCLAGLVGAELPLAWAFVFGALISPTDPVAVLATLREMRVPEELETDMAGESLFNDGVGVVVFTILLAVAAGGGTDGVGFADIAKLFFIEALGGALLGSVAGWVAYLGIRAIDDFPVEILISLALVTGTYALASRLHMSGPIAVVVAGLLLGNRGPHDAMSDQTQRYLFGFWKVVDEILNSVLFLLIGLEVVVLRFDPSFAWLMTLSVPLVLAARSIAVSLPMLALQHRQSFSRGTIPIMIWGGLRGGISVALALSVPENDSKALILAMTYTVVLFAIVVQGLSLRQLVKRVARTEVAGADPAPSRPPGHLAAAGPGAAHRQARHRHSTSEMNE